MKLDYIITEGDCPTEMGWFLDKDHPFDIDDFAEWTNDFPEDFDYIDVIMIQDAHANLGRVFFTKDIGLAKIYAGRAARSYGGSPVLFRVVSPVNVECLSDTSGATVYHADWAFCELAA